MPRDSIVAQLNIDMIGRGGAADRERGGPGYVQLVGSRRLSTELGDLVERVNTDGKHDLTFDYRWDADGHPSNTYCRSDHYMYARYGIPIAFFTTGSHAGLPPAHRRGRSTSTTTRWRGWRGLMEDVARSVADLDHRVVVDKPKPDPEGKCQ